MVSLTLWPFAPWHAAHTVAALALPASISAACANGATARTTDNPSTFFMGLLLCTRIKDYTWNPARTNAKYLARPRRRNCPASYASNRPEPPLGPPVSGCDTKEIHDAG